MTTDRRLSFLITFLVYHYQFRIQFVNTMENMEPSLTTSLIGTKEDSGTLDIPL